VLLRENESWLCGFYQGVGDAISVLPALKKIKEHYPKVNLVIAATASTAPIFEAAGVADRIIVFERFNSKTLFNTIRLVLCLRKYKFNRIFISPHAFRSGWKISLFSLLIKTQKCITYGNYYDIFSWVYTYRIKVADAPIALRELDFFAQCKIINRDKQIIYPRFTFERVDEKIASLVRQCKSKDNHPLLIGIHPGAGVNIKRWSNEKVMLLLKQILSLFNHSKVFLMVGPKERKEYDREFFDEQVFRELVLVHTDIISLMYLISQLDLLVCLDSGAAHIAAMFATPTVALYGSRPPSICGPVNKNAIVLYKDDLACRGLDCYKNKCHLNTNVCMRKITVDDVIKTVKVVLSKNDCG
jgi:ADP-heptose:LPS heptosyltransferase